MDINKLDPKDWVFKSQRQRVSPLPNYFSVETVCRDMVSKVGYNLDKVLYFLSNNTHTFFLHKTDYNRVGKGIANNIFRDSKLSKRLLKKQCKTGKILVKFTKKAQKSITNGQISNEKLYNLFVEFEKKYKDLYSGYGWIWICEDFLMADLLAVVEKKISNKKEAAEALDILTKEITAMVATVEREALLKLAVKIWNNQSWVNLIKNKNVAEIKKDKKLDKMIFRHEKDYFWLTRDYEDPILDFTSIISNLSGCLQTNPSLVYKELLEKVAKIKTDRERLLSSYDFSHDEVNAFASMRRVFYIKELRKRFVSEALYYFEDVTRIIGKHAFLSLNQVRHLTTADVKAILLDGKDMAHELNERIKMSLWLVDGENTKIIIGQDAKKVFDKFLAIDRNATEFIGMPVSPGIARGPIRIIINPDECDKVQKGDVILSIQVVPSFSTAIMKAAALVCDGGHGITTHPATLAREAGIPGIIQTRFAREVLKDGDMVEVDGYKGVVRKIF